MSLKHALLVCLIAACGGSAPTSQAPTTSASAATLDEALASSIRTPQERARDVYRHPKATLEFFGLRKDMHVVELWPGGGWYTKILAAYLSGSGKLTITRFAEDTDDAKHQGPFSNAPPFDKVDVVTLKPGKEPIVLGPDGSADLVVTFRNFHNWIQGGIDKDVVAAAYKVLKPGGVLGVVEHRGDVGQDEKTTKDSGYVPEQRVIDTLQAAGFKLAAKSDVNANPKDDHHHEGGVWALPPRLANGDKDKDKYVAIGESDRMTLKFTK